MGATVNPFLAISILFLCGLLLVFGDALKLRLKLGFADGMFVGLSLKICVFFFS